MMESSFSLKSDISFGVFIVAVFHTAQSRDAILHLHSSVRTAKQLHDKHTHTIRYADEG